MILLLWLSLLALSVVVALLGYFTDEEPYLTVGLTFLFLLSIVIITGTFQVPNGETKNVTFSYVNSTLSSQQEVSAVNYTNWNDTTSHIVGYLLAVLSGIGIALSLRNSKSNKGAQE